jgi:hypothetical protein
MFAIYLIQDFGHIPIALFVLPQAEHGIFLELAW